MVALFIDAGVEINAPSNVGYTPLTVAAKVNKGLYLFGYFCLFISNNQFFFFSLQNGQKEVVALLIDSGALVDNVNNYHHTPLYLAAEVSFFVSLVGLQVLTNVFLSSF